jgi:single-strand DNA-binding protein
MTDINSVIIIGRLTRDPEFAYTTGGTARLNLSIATNRSENKNGQWVDKPSFFDITLWGKQGERIKQYLHKGKQIAINGFLDQQRWEKDGQRYNKVCIIANTIQLLGGQQTGTQQEPTGEYSTPEDFSEDIPF